MCQNIEQFEIYSAVILTDLYRKFPVPIALDSRTLSGHHDTNEFGQVMDEQGNPSAAQKIALHTIKWLLDEGYLKAKEPPAQYVYTQCVLTAKGLNAFNYQPPHAKKRLGDQLIDQLKHQGQHLVIEVLNQIIRLNA